MREEGPWKETTEIPRYINEREAAKIMGVALQTLRNWRFQRRGPAYCKIGKGRMVRYSLSDLIDFMEGRKVNSEKG